MTKRMIASANEQCRHPGRRRAGETFQAKALLLALGGLFLLDVLYAFSLQNNLIKAVNYGFRTSLAATVVLLGTMIVIGGPIPHRLRLMLLGFMMALLVWVVVWALEPGALDSAVTIFFHPSFSIFSWLFVLTIPLAAVGYAEGVLPAFRRISLAILLGTLVIALLVMLAGVPLYMAPFAVAIFLKLCLDGIRKKTDRLKAAVTLVLLIPAMILSGNRTYAMASGFLLISFYLVPRITLVRARLATSFCLATPMILYSLRGYFSKAFDPTNPLFVDTRSFLFHELIGDLSRAELLLGRGIDGVYYSSHFYSVFLSGNVDGADDFVRWGSEVGWLNIILKFGCLGLLLFLLIVGQCLLVAKSRFVPMPVEGLRRFSILMLLIFMLELPNNVNFAYAVWFLALGTLCRLHHATASPLSPADHFGRKGLCQW